MILNINRFTFFIALVLITILIQNTITQSENQIKNVNKEEKTVKNILVFCFPGGKSHNFVFKELFKYSSEQMKKDSPKVDLKFHIIVHNFDKSLWLDTDHNIMGYGELKSYEDKFFKAMENAKEDPVLGYNDFNKAMIHLYYDFMSDGAVLESLRQTKFDLLLSDITNYLSVFLQQELKIAKHIYMNPTCIYTWINEVFEYNPSYHPLLGTYFSEKMNFFERFTNQIFLLGTRFTYALFKEQQSAVFKEFGYNYDLSPFPRHAMYLNQCVNGIHYSISLPSNIISTGAVLPKPSKKLDDPELDHFLNKFSKTIYVSQGTITKALRFEVLNAVFDKFSDVGFILSLKTEFHLDDHKIAPNVLLKTWVPQNDLLGDSRVNAFITHGGLNSILESLYHAKPMIVIGTSIDQVNGAVVVEYRRLGVGITSDKNITYDKLVKSIVDILSNEEYKHNCLVASELVKETDGKATFYYWLTYVLENGYEHLLISGLNDYNFFELNNYDVGLAWIFILYLVFKILNFLYRKFFGENKI